MIDELPKKTLNFAAVFKLYQEKNKNKNIRQ